MHQRKNNVCVDVILILIIVSLTVPSTTMHISQTTSFLLNSRSFNDNVILKVFNQN